ncbi:alpha/beta hydrolase [Speluncibacter jeojiensis]|uniref:alpha/beta hydrolase n=1 Tax=Speluncibacter jeojiensis TaxID=2710754 RepID=UPI0038CD28C4
MMRVSHSRAIAAGALAVATALGTATSAGASPAPAPVPTAAPAPGTAPAAPPAPTASTRAMMAAAKPAPDGSRLDHVVQINANQFNAYVYSAAMGKLIQLELIRPTHATGPNPTLYLLNGADGGESGTTDWEHRTDVVSFFAGKQVNVVIPIGGASSYYTDWLRPDPVLGKNEWKTFLTKELPPVIDSALGTTGKNSIAGLSMSGTSVLSLAESDPGLYKGVGAFSGCASTGGPVGQQYVKLVVDARGGGNTMNMWGPVDGPDWRANDPLLNAEKLRGTTLYISSGNGLPGPHENLSAPDVQGDPGKLVQQVTVGGVIEAATSQCTQQLRTRLNQLGIPATYDLRNDGTHSWGYWQDDLHAAWPVLDKAMRK